MPWDTVDSRDTRPEGPAFVNDDALAFDEGAEGEHAARELGEWIDPPERHDDLRDDAPAPSDPVGGGY